MSFDALKASDVTLRKKEVPITIGDKTYNFVAREIPYLQRLHLSSIQSEGKDFYTQLIVYSIVDEDGKHMTLAQAYALHEDHARTMFLAASEINRQESAEKN